VNGLVALIKHHALPIAFLVLLDAISAEAKSLKDHQVLATNAVESATAIAYSFQLP
jgi:hypothetical protein